VTTKLHGELRREISIGGEPYVLTITEKGMKLTEKGRRIGQEMRWADWVNGEAALARALNASLAPEPRAARAGKPAGSSHTTRPGKHR
jgi:hypothetical protein